MYFAEAIGEEAGWMGYAADPLMQRWTALQTGVMLGTVWAIWHVIGDFQAHHPIWWIVGQFVFTIAVRVLMVWIYNNTERSVLSSTISTP